MKYKKIQLEYEYSKPKDITQITVMVQSDKTILTRCDIFKGESMENDAVIYGYKNIKELKQLIGVD